MEDMSKHTIETGMFAVEFERKGHYYHLYIRFWSDSVLSRVYVCRSGVANPDIEGRLGSLSRLLSAISTEPDIVACSGCPLSFIQTIDKSPYFSHAVQYPFRFDLFDLEKMMHKKSFSVLGRIDFFSVMRQLLVSLGGSLEETWTISTPELSKVTFFNFFAGDLVLSLFPAFL